MDSFYMRLFLGRCGRGYSNGCSITEAKLNRTTMIYALQGHLYKQGKKCKEMRMNKILLVNDYASYLQVLKICVS